MEIRWAGEQLMLLPERAIWWPKEKTLFIADPHFGKASTFRYAGIPVPETSHDDDLKKLEEILRRHGAEHLVVLGDFFHAKAGRSEASMSPLAEWRMRLVQLKISLILGNHDLHAGPPPVDWNITCVKEPWKVSPFSLRHAPLHSENEFVLAGHLHPAFRLSEPNSPALTAVCFHFTERVGVLPAFGNFTGKAIIRAEKGHRVFVVAGNEVIEVSKIL